MRSGCLLIFILLSASFAQAQSEFTFILNKEGRITVIPQYKTFELKIPEYSYRSYTPATSSHIDLKLEEFMPDYQPALDERPMNMQVLSAAYKPFFNPYAPMLRRVSPMAFDFREVSVTPLNENFTFAVVGEQYTWPGLGGLTRINPMMVWNNGNWTLSGGAFAGRYFTPFNHEPDFMGGVNFQVRYDATNRLAFLAWGQYAHYGKEERYNPHMLLNPSFNHTSAGGAMEFKFNENFGVGMGVNFEYNPRMRRMEPQYLLYPVIGSKNFKIGIW